MANAKHVDRILILEHLTTPLAFATGNLRANDWLHS